MPPRPDAPTPTRLRPAAFLDRDGTLNVDSGFPASLDEIVYLPGVERAVARLNDLGLPVIVITNQSGVARGYFPESAVTAIHAGMAAHFAAAGARIDAFYFCPHYPSGSIPEYARRCDCRKPGPGLYLRAAAEHGIDLARSFMVGDKYSDVEGGKRLGMASLLVRTGVGVAQHERYGGDDTRLQPDAVVDDLPAAVEWIADRLG